MNDQNATKYSIVDLFAGAGGLSYGFLQTKRFTVKAAFEIDKNARDTYKLNHGNDVSMYNDVKEALTDKTKELLGQVDVVIGGPPCQGFSNANRQKNHAISHNNSLIKIFVQTVLHLDPSAFVMENVSMLRSNVHRFYVEINDQETIKKYKIPTTQTEIPLLDKRFMFEGVTDIIDNRKKLLSYRWREADYLTLNIVYKTRKNEEKLKATLKKHKKRLLEVADILNKRNDTNDHIINKNNVAGDAIKRYYSDRNGEGSALALCDAIEPAIMLQRMLFKALEIIENNIIVSRYAKEKGLVAEVLSMTVIDYIESVLGADKNGYAIADDVLSAAAFGVPQKRMRFVLIGIKKSISEKISMPTGSFEKQSFRTVEDAIKDIEDIVPLVDIKEGDKGVNLPKPPKNISELGLELRDSKKMYNHVSTKTSAVVLERFEAIKQGDNFHCLPDHLKTTYTDTKRTQNTIYQRLKYDEPSGTVVNVRKSMWIHPKKNRAISIREAARLQTFPDSFVFCGTKDSQYQQIGNAVPPMLAKAIARQICVHLDSQQ